MGVGCLRLLASSCGAPTATRLGLVRVAVSRVACECAGCERFAMDFIS